MTYKVPEGWEEVKLGDVAEYVNDKVSIDKCKTSSYISTTNMIENKGGVIEADELPKSKTVNSFKKNDILISNIRPYFKKIWFAEFDGTSSTDILIIRCTTNFEKKFLYYALSNDEFFNYATKTARGTKMPRGDKEAILQYKLPKLHLQEQKAIADTLSAIDDKIELNNKINQNLEAQAQAIFKHWFIDFEFPDKNGNPYKSSGGEMVESELGMIPKGWEVGELGDIISICNGKRPKEKADIKDEENKYPILGASGVMGYTNDYTYNEPILVIGRVGTHGVVQKVSDKVWASDNTMIIKTTYYEFVNQALLNLDYKSLNRGSTQPLLTQKDIKNQQIAIPYKNKDTLNLFENTLSKYRRQIDNLEIQNQTLSQLRDTLLPKLISGEIRIPLDK